MTPTELEALRNLQEAVIDFGRLLVAMRAEFIIQQHRLKAMEEKFELALAHSARTQEAGRA